MAYSLIAAIDCESGLAKDGEIPWHNPVDMRFFRYVTSQVHSPSAQNVLIMGRVTWESIGAKPLRGRRHVVLSRTHASGADPNFPDQVSWVSNFDQALDLCARAPNVDHVYVIGGAQLYKETLSRSDWAYCYLTRMNRSYDCDLDFPRLPASARRDSTLDLPDMTITRYVNNWQESQALQGWYPCLAINAGERAYLDLVERLAAQSRVTGRNRRDDRTGVGTYSEFGAQLVFDLSDGSFPHLVCKRVPFKMVLRELLFFVSGSTDARKLAAQNVHIWDDNTTRTFLDARGLTDYVEGDMGPMYGFQWRHAGATYVGCDADYTGQGVDQIKKIEALLRDEPQSRRIILSAHNVADLDAMALHPCHSMFQLYVTQDGYLCGKLTQRSADIFLGVPFNIASYALLLHMFARVSGFKVGKLIMSFGDVHLYHSHLDAVEKMMANGAAACVIPHPNLEITGDQITLDDFTEHDFTLFNYVPGPKITAPMAV